MLLNICGCNAKAVLLNMKCASKSTKSAAKYDNVMLNTQGYYQYALDNTCDVGTSYKGKVWSEGIG